MGLVLTLVGSLYLFFGSAKESENYSTIHVGSEESLVKKQRDHSNAVKKRKYQGRFGFLILAIGIMLQVISFIMQYPTTAP